MRACVRMYVCVVCVCVCVCVCVRACVRACIVRACVHVFLFKLLKCCLRQMKTNIVKFKKLFWLIILTETTFPMTTSVSTLKIGSGVAPTGR